MIGSAPVAIAAVGVICGLGRGMEALGEGLRRHRCGAVPTPDLPGGRAVLAPMIADLEGFPDDRKTALLADALLQAAGGAPVASERCGVFLGTGLSSVTPLELAEDVYPNVTDGVLDWAAIMRDLRPDRVAPRRHLPARATGWAAERVGATGPCGTTFSACAAGAEAIAEGARAIARGEADVVYAGGHDSMAHPLGMLSFQVLGALSEGLGRPFDRRRDGFTLGEGAAVLRLERADRCAAPLGWILGAGSSMDAYGITAPHPDGAGAEASMRRALADAGVDPGDVDWINTHGTGTPLGDLAESLAIRRLFGEGARISSVKGALGHTLAAAGAVEAAVTLAAIAGGFTPGTVGCEEPDDLGLDVLVAPTGLAPTITVSNSFGFGGQNCTLILAAPGFS